MRNCPNCGAPIDPYRCKCEYCGTYYFNFTAFDISEDKPCYVKIQTKNGTITTLAIPKDVTYEMIRETADLTDDLEQEINTRISSVFRFKGTVANYAGLSDKTDAIVDDVWLARDTSKEYVCISRDESTTPATISWEELGHTVDLSGYATTADLDDDRGTVVGRITTNVDRDLTLSFSCIKLVEFKTEEK